MFRIRVRELREAAGFRSQQAFADAFGVAQTTVASWEGGKREPGHETTIRLANFFNVTVDYLLGRESISASADVGEKIAHWRKVRGLTQVALAEKSYISRSYLAGVEIGKYNPSLDTLLDIASALNVKLSILLGEEAATEGDGSSLDDTDYSNLSDKNKVIVDQLIASLLESQSDD